MKKYLLALFLSLMLLSFVSVLQVQAASDVKLSPEQIGLINMNCNSSKIQLEKVQKVDAKIRAELGGSYETLLSSFMTSLNLRLVRNNIAHQELIDDQSLFSAQRDDFKQHYIQYSKKFDRLLETDCRAKPKLFYKRLNSVRKARAVLGEDYINSIDLLEKHQEKVKALMEKLWRH